MNRHHNRGGNHWFVAILVMSLLVTGSVPGEPLPVTPAPSKKAVTLSQLKKGQLKVGLALSGGAAKGMAHIGVIKALEEAGIRIDYIAGTSMGALVGAVYASGVPIDSLKNIAVSTDWKTAARLFMPDFSPSGLIDGKRVEDFLSTLFGDRRIESLPIPFAATAVDISSGQLYVINSGNLLEAVRASISIPIVFKPVSYGNNFLVDGGVVNPMPIDVVREMGAEYIIAVHVIHAKLPDDEKEYISIERAAPQKSRLFSIETMNSRLKEFLKQAPSDTKPAEAVEKAHYPKLIEISQNAVYIAQDAIAQYQIELLKPDLVIEPDTRSISMFEFYRGYEAVEIGYQEAQKILKALQ